VVGDPEVIPSSQLVEGLLAMAESPWRDLRGRPLDQSSLALRLRSYEVRSLNIRIGNQVVKGYRRADLQDAWTRYLTPTNPNPADAATPATGQDPDGRTGFEAGQ
jgi:hypothetical protein